MKPWEYWTIIGLLVMNIYIPAIPQVEDWGTVIALIWLTYRAFDVTWPTWKLNR